MQATSIRKNAYGLISGNNLLRNDNENGSFTTISRYEKIVSICFIASVFAILLQIPGSGALKYVALPVCMLLLYRTDMFDYLLYPISFSENVIGTLFFGKITLLWLYLLLLALKLFLVQKKNPVMELSYFVIFVFFSIYQLMAFSDYGMNSFKSVLFMFLSIIIVDECQKRERGYNKLFWIILLSAMMQAFSLAFSLTGNVVEISERTTGVGFADPNYACFILLIGFCVLINLSTKTPKGKSLQIGCCLLFCLAVFRSGSRSGIVTGLGILLTKFFIIKGAKNKSKYIVGMFIIILIVLFLISSGIIKIPGGELIMQRIVNTIDSYQSGNMSGVTAGRDVIASRYFKYCFSRNPFSILFGGTVVASTDLLSLFNQVTHNVYLDYLLAFGVIGTIFFIFVFIKRAWKQFLKYRESADLNMLMLVEIKMCMMFFGMTLSMMKVNIWWLLFLL